MKKVLIFTYHWPPGSGPGVQRFLKFCKYLPKYGWEPIVITVKDGSYPSIDESLIDDIPEGLEVHKTKTFEPFTIYNALRGKKGKSVSVGLIGIKDRKSPIQKLSMHVRANYFIPDARKGWKTYALKAAEKVINQNDIDLIISTGPPHSTHLIGMELQEKHNIPWVADMRDPWTEIHYNKDLPRSEKTKEKDLALERKALTAASHVITVSDGLKEQLEKYNEATSVVYNGFDEDDYKPLEPFKTEKFTLAYIGNLKPNQHIKTLWRVLLELCNENEQFKQHFRLELTGNVHEVIVNEIKSLGLENNLNAYPFVEHRESVKRMQKSCMLLFIVPQTEKNNLILTGKLFEYLASGTPLLSTGPVAGNAAKIIAGCSRGTLLDYNNEIGIKESLLKAFDSWMSSSQECPQLIVNSEIEQYSRQLQTKKLVSFFDKIVE